MIVPAKKRTALIGILFLVNLLALVAFSQSAQAVIIKSITVARANSADQSTLTPGSATITANGTSTQVLTVTVKDTNGNNVTSGGANVAITKSSGTGLIGSVTDNGNGTYSATVTSPTTIGNGVFVATLAGAPVKGGTPLQSEATVTYIAGTTTQIVIETAADGSGSAITTKSIASVGTFTAYAISRDASGNFVANVPATWSLTGKIDGVADSDLVAGDEGKSAVFTAHLTGTATVHAVSGSLTDDTGLVTVSSGIASKLAFTTQPSASTVSGVAFAQQPVVTIQDAAGNTVTDAINPITLSLTTGEGTLGGTLSMEAVNGVADFSGKGVNINQAGTDKVLTASATGLTSATTTPAFSIVSLAVTSVALTSANHASNVSTNWVNIYTKDDVVTATVKFSGPVTVTGTPTLSLNIGGTAKSASYASGSGTTDLLFTYTIENQLADTDGIAIQANALALSGGTIKDAGNHAATLVHSAVADNVLYQVLTIGGSYEGGKIAYFLVSGDNPLGTISGNTLGSSISYSASAPHGLIAQATDISAGILWARYFSKVPGIESQSYYSSTASGIRLGDGAANTVAIYNQNGDITDYAYAYAAGLVMASSDGGKIDWYLPSSEELDKLRINRSVFGYFMVDNDIYWSSSEKSSEEAWGQFSYDGFQAYFYKSDLDAQIRVRAVRSF